MQRRRPFWWLAPAVATLLLGVLLAGGAPATRTPLLARPAGTTTTTTTTTTATTTAAPVARMSEEARRYLTAALDLMQQRSIRRTEIDWTELRVAAFKAARNARRPEDTYVAIRAALRQLGDRHSFFMEPAAVRRYTARNPSVIEHLEGRALPGRLGYLSVPGTQSGSQQGAQTYIRQGRDALVRVNGANVCGWIVDLRQNRGGNMWPMLGMLGPIIGDGVAGYFVDPDGRRQPWTIDGMRALLDGQQLSPDVEPYRLRRPGPPVAVLTGRETVSAGEATLIAFLGRPATRTFGTPTAGLPTANAPHELPDGAVLIITEAAEADRTGRVHHGAIEPDEHVAHEPTAIGGPDDRVVAAASQWLAGQPACHRPR